MLVASCSSTPTNNLITPEGVAGLTFGMEKPVIKGYKAEFQSFYDEMDDYTEEYWEFKKGGEVAVTYWVDYRIDVFSPDFETAEGLKPGMTLTEAQQVLGKTDFEIYDSYLEIRGLIFTLNDKMAFVIQPEDMNGGLEAFNAWWAKGVGKLKVSDFNPEAKIEKIMIRKGE